MKIFLNFYLTIVLFVQLNKIVTGTHGSKTLNQVQNDNEYIEKYLPNLWNALQVANPEGAQLLTLPKLKEPADNLTEVLKECIIKYLMYIKPVAMVKLSSGSEENCSVRVIKNYVDVLRRISKDGFRCLQTYRINTSNVYADAPKLSEVEEIKANATFRECLSTTKAKAHTDMESLQGKINECADEISGKRKPKSSSSSKENISAGFERTTSDEEPITPSSDGLTTPDLE